MLSHASYEIIQWQVWVFYQSTEYLTQRPWIRIEPRTFDNVTNSKDIYNPWLTIFEVDWNKR